MISYLDTCTSCPLGRLGKPRGRSRTPGPRPRTQGIHVPHSEEEGRHQIVAGHAFLPLDWLVIERNTGGLDPASPVVPLDPPQSPACSVEQEKNVCTCALGDSSTCTRRIRVVFPIRPQIPPLSAESSSASANKSCTRPTPVHYILGGATPFLSFLIARPLFDLWLYVYFSLIVCI